MANQTKIRSSMPENGGKHLHEHMLVNDSARGVRHSEHRPSADDTVHGSKQQNGGSGTAQSASEEASNEDDEEDSSGGQDDDKEDEEDDPEALAPSHGLGKGKGLRPAIRFELAGDDDSHDDETLSHEAGLKASNGNLKNLLKSNGNSKKRTFSNLSSTSVLFGDEDAGPLSFPRPKMARKLSRTAENGLLTYHNKPTDMDDNAIASSDDEDNNLDDEDYSGVLEVPDDETDIEEMEQEEEHFIIQEEEQHGNDLFSAEFDLTRRHSIGSYGSDDILSLSMGDNFAFTDLDFAPADPGFGQFFEQDPPLPTSPEPISKRKFSDSSTKRVRFDDEVQVSDSSSDSELDSATFPDLFMEQEKLPPSIYQELIQEDNDSDIADLPSDISEQSYWDVGQDEARNPGSFNQDEFDESSDPGSSGYETDMGDTTDEYDSDFGDEPPNPRTPRTKKSVLRRPASAPSSRLPSPSPFQRGNVVPPPRGVFIHDDSRRAIAVTDRFTKTITFYRPRSAIALQNGTYSSTSSTANNSPRASVIQLNASDSELSNEMLSNAFMGSDIMFSGLFGNNQSNTIMFGGDSIGPPEAFYPFVNVENGNVVSEDDEYDDEDYEDDLNLADFMDFGPDIDDTDVDQDDETDVPATPATSMVAAHGSTPAQPTPYAETPSSVSRNVSDAMLEHFDRAGVTAFRNNQNRYRDIARLPHDPHVRASVSKPIRSGRSAETLMSPLRKRSTMPKKQRNSPFSGVTKATSRLQSSVMNSRRAPPMGTFS